MTRVCRSCDAEHSEPLSRGKAGYNEDIIACGHEIYPMLAVVALRC